jgi:hypothetical protein
MSAVMLETLVWTGVLIALVLVLRRAVARSFGPEAAYALWALPTLRLVLPPITLPAAMAPAALLPAAPCRSRLRPKLQPFRARRCCGPPRPARRWPIRARL